MSNLHGRTERGRSGPVPPLPALLSCGVYRRLAAKIIDVSLVLGTGGRRFALLVSGALIDFLLVVKF